MKFLKSRATAYAVFVIVGGLGWYVTLSAFDLFPEIRFPRKGFLAFLSYVVQLVLIVWAAFATQTVCGDAEAFLGRRVEAGPWKPAHMKSRDVERRMKWIGGLILLWMAPILLAFFDAIVPPNYR